MQRQYVLQIVSLLYGQERVLRPYMLDEIPTVGVARGEPFALRVTNNTWSPIEARLVVDGLDIFSGERATENHSLARKLYVDAHNSVTMKAWPLNMERGAQFVFAERGLSVAYQIGLSSETLGYIGAGIFEDLQGGPVKFAKLDGGLSHGITTNTLGAAAGDDVSQPLRPVKGLGEPVLTEEIMLRYMDWDTLRLRVEQQKKTNHHPPLFLKTAQVFGMSDTLQQVARVHVSGNLSAATELSRFED